MEAVRPEATTSTRRTSARRSASHLALPRSASCERWRARARGSTTSGTLTASRGVACRLYTEAASATGTDSLRKRLARISAWQTWVRHGAL